MAQRSAAWRYGWRLGLVAAGFAALQVLVMVDAGRATETPIKTLQFSLSNITYPGSTILPLVIMILATYLSMALSGLAMLWFAARAGQLAAAVSGQRGDGGLAGMWVALVSGVLWLAVSLLVVGLVHVDGTVTGAFTANPVGPLRPAELIALAIQELFLALLGLGLGALAGSRGAAHALPPRAFVVMPLGTPTAWGPWMVPSMGGGMGPVGGYPPAWQAPYPQPSSRPYAQGYSPHPNGYLPSSTPGQAPSGQTPPTASSQPTSPSSAPSPTLPAPPSHALEQPETSAGTETAE